MKNLNLYLNESLRIGINDSPDNNYTYYPETRDHLREILLDRIKEEGKGTKDKPINLNDIDVSKIKEFDSLFLGFYELNYIDISNWNVRNAEDMSCMFIYCEKLKSIGDISEWELDKIEDMVSMFEDCKSLTDIGDITKWNWDYIEENVDTSDMFTGSSIEIANDVPWCN